MSLATAFNYFANSIWQVPLLALCCWGSLRLMRASAQLQYCVWVVTLVLCVALPLRGASVAPLAPVDVAAVSAEAPIDFVHPLAAAPLPFYAISIRPHTRDLLADLYLVVCAFFLVRLLLSHLALRRLVRTSVAHTPSLSEQALLDSCGNSCATLCVLPLGHRTPMVVGVLHPVLLLPAALLTADRDTLYAVLAHELTHLRRRDTLANVLLRAGSLPIAYHPATAFVHRRMQHARELLCDEAAARALPSPGAYAHVLLKLAQQLIHPGDEAAVGLFTRTSKPLLEERIMHLISPPARLRAFPRFVRSTGAAALFALAAVTLFSVHLMPTVQAAEGSPMTPSLTVHQPVQPSAQRALEPSPADSGKGKPKHSAVPMTAEEKQAVATLSDADFKKQLAIALKGSNVDSAELRKELTQLRAQLNSSDLKRKLLAAREIEMMDLARGIHQSLSEQHDQLSIDLAAQLGNSDFRHRLHEAAQAEGRPLQNAELARLVADEKVQAPSQSPGPVKVSGGVMAGAIVSRVQPVYPEDAKAARIEGAVVLQAIIGKDGAVQSLRCISGPEMLRASAVEAVRQWVYRPYLLNGEPTEVETTITVTYSFGS